MSLIHAFCAILFAFGATACGGAADHPSQYEFDETEESEGTDPETESDAGAGIDTGTPSGECVEGATQTCKITLPSQGSVENCVVGTQYCDEGFWSECEPDTM